MNVNLYKYEQVFQNLDRDNLGYVTLKQLYFALNTQLKISMDMKTLEVMMTLVDDNNDGVMQEDEFCHFIYICENADFKDTKSILFFAADDDYSGSIDKFELLKITKKLKLNLNQNQVFKTVQEVGDNDDGSLSYNSFIKVMNEMIPQKQTDEPQMEPQTEQGVSKQKKTLVKCQNQKILLKNATISFI
ncbi:EF_hand domain-containing protein [Hexamita inflata]|uniref:EF hand domain-containing protein n=1 Tax=Hexamita inflata TaxID=28002 RepID=A0AA86R2P6_9EUKA|nr:EF hand domain-containing protein [Hexamita inflata]